MISSVLMAAVTALPPVAVALEPADCPTEAQLQRVLAALGARLVPFGSPAKATVFAQRDASGEWSLSLGRPGFNEKRKLVLSGGCDERAAALGAIIERFARPVLVQPPEPKLPLAVDAGLDAGARAQLDAGPLDAGTPSDVPFEAVAEPPPPPLAGLPPPPPPPSPSEAPADGILSKVAVGARGGVAVSSVGFAAVAEAWGEFRWSRAVFGAALGYLGPTTLRTADGNLKLDQVRPQFFARLRAVGVLSLEACVLLTAAFGGLPAFPRRDPFFDVGLGLGALVNVPVGFIEFWAALRGFVFLSADGYLLSDDETRAHLPTLTGELTVGAAIRL